MMGRPDSTEAAEFYWTYIDKVPGDDAVAAMVTQLEQASALLTGITEGRSLHRYAPAKWSIREVLNHVTDAERIFLSRTLWFARELPAALPGFDEKIAVTAAKADEVPWAAHIDEFLQVRVATLSFFRNLPAEAWTRKGTASDKVFSVKALLFITVGHAAHHLDAIRELYLAG